VKQIVLNLLTNAIKFTPQGAILVGAGYDRARDEISLAVKDTGIGIAESDQRKIFEDFRQATTPSPPVRRSGPRALHLPASREHAGGAHHGRQQAGRGLDVHPARARQGRRP